jgi:hypothetical protein
MRTNGNGSDEAPHGNSSTGRARIAAAGFCMQLALGAVYGWNVFLTPLQDQFSALRRIRR